MKYVLLLSIATLLFGCGGRRYSEAELQHKIDSVNALEMKRQLRLQNIRLAETSPLQLFYDSLHLQPLPLSYSEEYVKYLPDFTIVPVSIASYLRLEGREQPKAIALPETLGSRLMLLAADVDDYVYELWLYSLDNDYMPVDKLLLYSPQRYKGKLRGSKPDVYFSITSYYDINVVEYADKSERKGHLSIYVVDDSRQFALKKPL